MKEPIEFVKRLGDWIREVRTEQGMSQEQIARAAGISRRQYHRLERGEVLNPSFYTFLQIVEALDVLEVFLGWVKPLQLVQRIKERDGEYPFSVSPAIFKRFPW